MQEERSSIENTADQKVEAPVAENTKKQKKASKKKEPKIPTVNEIVEKEEALAAGQKESRSQEADTAAEKPEVTEEKAPVAEEVSVKEEKAPVTEENTEAEPAPVTEKAPEAEEAPVTEEAPEKEETQSQEEKPAEENKDDTYEEESDSEEEAEAAKTALEEKRKALNLDSETALVEAVLFLESEPQNTASLAKITQLSEDVITEALARLRERYSDADSGIEITEIIGGWMLVPKKESFEFVKERYGKKNEGRLSKAAIETLSIIAYSQPVTRAEIESIRHVNADNMMRVLLDRHFIKEVGKKDIPGKPILYGTTKEFLEFFHLQSISDLPQLDEKESERFELAR